MYTGACRYFKGRKKEGENIEDSEVTEQENGEPNQSQ